MQKYPLLKPDWFCKGKLLSIKKLHVLLLYIILSNILLQIGNKDTGR